MPADKSLFQLAHRYHYNTIITAVCIDKQPGAPATKILAGPTAVHAEAARPVRVEFSSFFEKGSAWHHRTTAHEGGA